MRLPGHVGLDTNCFVYYLENPVDARAAYLEREVFGQMRVGQRSAVTSALTVAEFADPAVCTGSVLPGGGATRFTGVLTASAHPAA